MNYQVRKSGFTLIELLVVIAIIGVLSTLAIIALGSARQKARDSKRVGDISQLNKALELYYSDNAAYPTVVTPGQPLVSLDGSKTYLASIPSNPSPRTDGNCPNQDYMYVPRSNGQGYTFYYCIGSAVGAVNAGFNIASETATNNDGSLILRLDAGIPASYPGTGTTWTDLSGKGNNGTFGSGTNAPSFNSANGGSLLFDNTDLGNDYVQLGNIFSGTGDFTIIAWVKNSQAATATIIGNYGLPVATGQLQVSWKTTRAPSIYIEPTTVFGTSTGTYYPGVISQIAITRSSGSITGYSNATQMANVANNAAITTNNFRIGANTSASPAEPFLGNIYQILVYNRGLSAAEITASFNAQKTRYGLP